MYTMYWTISCFHRLELLRAKPYTMNSVKLCLTGHSLKLEKLFTLKRSLSARVIYIRKRTFGAGNRFLQLKESPV